MINTIKNYLIKNKFFDIKISKTDVLEVDFIIIASALSSRQIQEISRKLAKYVKSKYNLSYITVCGSNTNWVIVDCDVILVHIMLVSVRDFYKIDDLYN